MVHQMEQQMVQRKVATMVEQMVVQMVYLMALMRVDRSVAQRVHHLVHLKDVLTAHQRVDTTGLPMAEYWEYLTAHWMAALSGHC